LPSAAPGFVLYLIKVRFIVLSIVIKTTMIARRWSATGIVSSQPIDAWRQSKDSVEE
jgi:hypothetical protein